MIQEHGIALCLGAVLLTATPIIVGTIAARIGLGLSALETLGGICGGMTSTPDLGVLINQVESNKPVTSYATIYPVALVLMSLATPVLILLLS